MKLIFSNELAESRFSKLVPRAQELAVEMALWAKENFNIDLVFTETFTYIGEDRKLGRISDSHRTGRAFDIRTRGLPETFIAQFCAHFRKKYPGLGAIKDGCHNLIVYRPHGSGPHLHIQIKRQFTEDNYGT